MASTWLGIFLKTLCAVLMDPKLEFREHMQEIHHSSYRALGFLLRNAKDFKDLVAQKNSFHDFSPFALGPLWGSLGASVLKPLLSSRENFLRYMFYTKCGFYSKYLSEQEFQPKLNFVGVGSTESLSLVYQEYPDYRAYSKMCQDFGCMSLRPRRDMQLVSYLCRIIHGWVNCSATLETLNFYVPAYERVPGRYSESLLHRGKFISSRQWSGWWHRLPPDLDIFNDSSRSFKKGALKALAVV